jgi:arylsulfatase A-like enzyme
MKRRTLKRRTFLKGTGLAGAALLGAGAIPATRMLSEPAPALAAGERPNILFLMVDQLRPPQWFPPQAQLDTMLPALARLRTGAVNFGHHYTAATMCQPARACLLTGLYTHQTAVLSTGAGTPQGGKANVPGLNPGFPTWGTMLRQMGYQTNYYGKWHLSNTCDLAPYGFSGGTCPSPNGLPGEGLAKDASIVDQFLQWFHASAATGPWCTTVSLVNPHDIAWFPRLTRILQGENNPPRVFTSLPANFETPQHLLAQHKPRLQRAMQQFENVFFGVVPFGGPGSEKIWLRLLDTYLLMQRYVDRQIGRVLNALEAQPDIARRTIIIFTADHGEYAGSHGLRGKGGAAYEESIRVPLYVKDLTGLYARHPEIKRTQLTSSVDIVPLLLTLASGGNAWRQQPQYAHLAQRLDLAFILRNPSAPGRPYVLHTMDEDEVEGFAVTQQARNAPAHVIAYRTATAKLGLYSFWKPGSIEIQTAGQEAEVYDYRTRRGRMELENVAMADRRLYNRLNAALVSAIPMELRAPLPAALQPAQQAGLQSYLKLQAQQAQGGRLPDPTRG